MRVVVAVSVGLLAWACTSGGGGDAASDAGTLEPDAALDDPFDLGPTYCETNGGAGGDSCTGWLGSAGFFTSPGHLTTGHDPTVAIRVTVRTEYTPSTPLKNAVEQGTSLRAFGSDEPLPAQGSWDVERSTATITFGLELEQPLDEGWYSLWIPRSAREALGAPYTHFVEPPLFTGGYFVELDDGDLRADFRVGSRPLVARVAANSESVTIEFSEEVAAEDPPVTVRMGTYDPRCAPDEWGGSGTALYMACTDKLLAYGDPVTITFGAGFEAAGGEPLRGPDGATEFAIDVPEQSSLQLEVPPEL